MLKRNMIICIRESGTTDDPVVLPVVDESIDINTKQVSTSITNVNPVTPKLSERLVNKGVQESTIKFTTYIKPYTAGNAVSIIDDLLYKSLFSYTATSGYYETTDSFSIQKFDIYVVYTDTGTTFSLENAVTISATFNFDINGIARITWEISGVEYKQNTTPTYIYPSNIDSYIINKWTQARLDFPLLSSGYDLASTNFTLSIKNTIQYPYNEKMNQRFATPDNEPILEKRTISAKFNMYLKVISLPIFNDIISTIEQYSYLDDPAKFTAVFGDCGGVETLKIEINNVNIKYPKTKLDEVAALELDMLGEQVKITYT